jgi:hypothetical protein
MRPELAAAAHGAVGGAPPELAARRRRGERARHRPGCAGDQFAEQSVNDHGRLMTTTEPSNSVQGNTEPTDAVPSPAVPTDAVPTPGVPSPARTGRAGEAAAATGLFTALDRTIAELADGELRWACTTLPERARLLTAVHAAVAAQAENWATTASRAKLLDADSPFVG